MRIIATPQKGFRKNNKLLLSQTLKSPYFLKLQFLKKTICNILLSEIRQKEFAP